MSLLGSIVGAGAALLGGALDNKAASDRAADARRATDPATIRRKAEAAGFNPLLFTGQAFSTAGATATPTIGASIASAAEVFLNTQHREQQLQLQRTQLQQQNERLAELVETSTVRSPIGGVYSARTGQVNSRPVQGVSAGSRARVASGVVDGGNGPLATTSGGDPLGITAVNSNEAPQFTAFGVDFRPSGNFSNGEAFEAALGESPVVSTIVGPLIAGDTALHTGRMLGRSMAGAVDDPTSRYNRRLASSNRTQRTAAIGQYVRSRGYTQPFNSVPLPTPSGFRTVN